MPTRQILLDAAEQIVRDQGSASLTVRSLAAHTNFGKSTVHEAVGSMESLWGALRERAVHECLDTVGPEAALAADLSELAGMHRMLGMWVVANPDWALLAFSAPEASWDPPLDGTAYQMLSYVGADADLDLSTAQLEHLARFACALCSAAARFVISQGDAELAVPTFGAAHVAIEGALRMLSDPEYRPDGTADSPHFSGDA